MFTHCWIWMEQIQTGLHFPSTRTGLTRSLLLLLVVYHWLCGLQRWRGDSVSRRQERDIPMTTIGFGFQHEAVRRFLGTSQFLARHRFWHDMILDDDNDDDAMFMDSHRLFWFWFMPAHFFMTSHCLVFFSASFPLYLWARFGVTIHHPTLILLVPLFASSLGSSANNG